MHQSRRSRKQRLFHSAIATSKASRSGLTSARALAACAPGATARSAPERMPLDRERGAGLAGCHMQRLSSAWAPLTQPTVLIFDEATSSLDQNTVEHFALITQKDNAKLSPYSRRLLKHVLRGPKNFPVSAIYACSGVRMRAV